MPVYTYHPDQLRYAIDHVFLPPRLPQESDQTGEKDHALAAIVFDASKAFRSRLSEQDKLKWTPLMKLLRDFKDIHTSNFLTPDHLEKTLKDLMFGDTLALFVRAQNAGVIFRRDFDTVCYECFEVIPPAPEVLSTTGKLIMSFPGPAIEFPADPFDSKHFRAQLAAFLADMNNAVVVEEDEDEDRDRRKSGLAAAQAGETQNPMYITSLLSGVLRGLSGQPAEVTRINKRIGDDVLLKNKNSAPWRRSALYLVLRVALQTTLQREDPSHRFYKQFMLFLHAHMLNVALHAKTDSDLLFTMRAKTCRRQVKLGDNVPEFLVEYVKTVCERVEDELQRRWTQIREVEIKPPSVVECPWVPDQLNVAADAVLRLTNSQGRISMALGDSPMNNPPTSFEPHESDRLRDVASFGELTPGKLDAAFKSDPFVNLADFENHVGRGSMDSWLDRRVADGATARAQETAATILFGAMRRYHAYASIHYKDSPEDQSLMVLTMFELWVALDRLAVAACPLLSSYSPEVPIDRSVEITHALLRPLLLRKSVDLDRLLAVDAYIRSRHEHATRDRSVFSEKINANSFAVKFFDRDPGRELRSLKAQIEREAQAVRDEVLRDLETKMERRRQLRMQISRTEHEHDEDSRIAHTTTTGKRRKKTYTTYTWDCECCRLEEEMAKLSVSVHEWPLPSDEDQAKRVVFELRPPRAFAQWRAATAVLLWDLCTPANKQGEFDKSRPAAILNTCDALSEYMRPGDDVIQIVTLASSTDSAKTFGSTKKLPTTQEEICVPSGMSWRLFEPRSKVWVRGSTPTAGINGTMFREADTTQYGTLYIHNSSSVYARARLQYAVSGTLHTSNKIIASQEDCPAQMSLHEYVAFANLRSGARLQWMNLLRELREGTLSWQNEEVGTLVAMLMWQVGCIEVENGNDEGARGLEWHTELKDSDFGDSLLREMRNVLRHVQGNWKEVATVRTLILLTSRLLASASHTEVIEQCYALLRDARRVTWEWVGQLEAKLQGCSEEVVKELQDKVCEMACTCRATFDVDIDEWESDAGSCSHLDALLCTAEDVEIFLACGIIVHDNKPHNSASKSVSKDLKKVVDRDRRLAHGVEPVLHKLFLRPTQQAHDVGFRTAVMTIGKEGLNRALVRIWAVYEPGVPWIALAEPNDRWVACETAAGALSSGVGSQEVHLSLMDGKLLVNGKPLGRLPTAIVKHATYVRIFGEKKVLDVVPSQLPGMQFATRSMISGFQVFFGVRGENDVIIRARRDDVVYELIPHTYFSGDLPTRFVEDHVHWLNLQTAEIELRPLSTKWETSPRNWVITFGEDRRTCINDSRALIDINSWTFQMIAATLEPFETSQFLTVTCSRDLEPYSLSVDLPRYRLSFFRNKDEQLECINFPRMIIDHDDQSIGALVGLKSRLVLRASNSAPAGVHRKVLVPFGEVLYASDDNHVNVAVATQEQRDVQYADYSIDTDQGCLFGNSSLRSRLYQIYLTALSSHCLPDPLTGHTGTEEALLELNYAATMSFRELGDEETSLVIKIGKLTPVRYGAPQHNAKSQSITWTSLPPLSHHYAFALRCREILNFAQQLRVFDETSTEPAPKKDEKKKKEALAAGNTVLDTRGASRAGVYYTGDMKGTAQIRDVTYSSRDTELLGEVHTYTVASSVFTGSTVLLLPRPPSLPELFRSVWPKTRAPSEHFSLSYSRPWFTLRMADSWLSIYEQCRAPDTSKEKKKYQLLFSLPAMTFRREDYARYVPSIVAIIGDGEFQRQKPPAAVGHSFDFSVGTRPDSSRISSYVEACALPVEQTASWNLPLNQQETAYDHLQRRMNHHKAQVKRAAKQVTTSLAGQWDAWTVGNVKLALHGVDTSLFNRVDVLDQVKKYYKTCNANRLLLRHANKVQSILNVHFDEAIAWDIAEYDFSPCSAPRQPTAASVTLRQLLRRAAPALTERSEALWGDVEDASDPDAFSHASKLKGLLSDMQRSSLVLRKRYAKDLEESRENLNSLLPSRSRRRITYTVDELLEHQSQCGLRRDASFSSILSGLEAMTNTEKAVDSAGIWPRLTHRSLLRQLAYPANASLNEDWRDVLLYFARDILEYQRAVRLLAYAQQDKPEDFFRELDTRAFDMESARRNPDWLLIQIEGNFLARPLQLKVAQEMIAPSSNANTVLQLNMGEGKSSVIVPLVAAALADGKKIVRVVVLKPLAGQMFQLLVERLSGLANRRIFYMPFSRKTRVGESEINQIQRSYQTCMREGGVWIVQPEHILSFKLMSIDRCLVSDTEADRVAAELLAQSQRWLDANSRDVLDESDEILHIRYQLVYTIGQQQPLELHPDRWTIAEELFSFVTQHIEDVKARNKTGIDVQLGPAGSFVPIQILDIKAGRDLMQRVVDDVFSGRLSSFNVRFLPEAMQTLARQFVTEQKVEEQIAEELRAFCGGGNDWKHLLLLRGLIAHGILLYALKDRHYRVDYGLDVSRSLLAVPYRAKDVPSIRAEFGHPDVAVVLTCLTYYYEGLTSAQLKLCFNLLFKLDNPPLEYAMWVDKDPTVPVHLQTLNGINTDDTDQHSTYIIPLFSKRKTVVDFYMSHVVFPKAAKEFPHKLSSSGWDLAEAKPGHVTTGFSGTNDNRFLLPTSIAQQDPLQQNGTNAKVLTYLLQKENDFYRCAQQVDGGHLTVKEFLAFLTRETLNSPVQLLLDVGAQMLDLKNDALAREWLKLRPDMAAAIFFNDKDEMTVLLQDGTQELLISSPFKGQLDRCLVYLDDAHTRGIDLKMPTDARAAVTLGPKVTKDRLIQGCMRMRKLGMGQSVLFFAPSELDRRIRDQRKAGTNKSAPIHTVDILRWAMYETCRDIMHHVPHWAEQGWDYLRRRRAWEAFNQEAQVANEGVVNPDIDTLKKVWVREEARSLEKMYGCQSGPQATGLGSGDLTMRESIFGTPELKDRLDMLGVKELQEVNVDEEQEREVSHEIEKETHIERPPRVTPASHHISEGIKYFVSNGVLPNDGQGEEFRKGFIRMYRSIEGTVKRMPLNGEDVWSPGLYITRDCATTISEKDAAERGMAEYLRPINWLLTSRRYEDNNVIVILSPFEVNYLLPQIRKSPNVNLHVYAPRVTKDMLPLDDLKFYAVPKIPASWVPIRTNIRTQLNLFSGQLYLGSYDVYCQLCNFLGLHSGDEDLEPMEVDDEPYPIQSDGFVRPGRHREGTALEKCRFQESPIPFLQELIGLRRKGTGYLPTHLGRIVHGRMLKQDDFDY